MDSYESKGLRTGLEKIAKVWPFEKRPKRPKNSAIFGLYIKKIAKMKNSVHFGIYMTRRFQRYPYCMGSIKIGRGHFGLFWPFLAFFGLFWPKFLIFRFYIFEPPHAIWVSLDSCRPVDSKNIRVFHFRSIFQVFNTEMAEFFGLFCLFLKGQTVAIFLPPVLRPLDP